MRTTVISPPSLHAGQVLYPACLVVLHYLLLTDPSMTTSEDEVITKRYAARIPEENIQIFLMIYLKTHDEGYFRLNNSSAVPSGFTEIIKRMIFY